MQNGKTRRYGTIDPELAIKNQREQKETYQNSVNKKFMEIVKELEVIHGHGEKARICDILGIKDRMGSNLFNGKNNVKPIYLEQVKARLRNAKG